MPTFRRSLFYFVLALLLAVPLLVAPGGTQAAPPPNDIDQPHQTQACPGGPAALPDQVERTDFCIYYDDGTTTAAQATTAADHVQAYWDRYTDDFGFKEPKHTNKLQVELTVNSGCNGATSSSSNVLDAWTGCYGNAESIQKVLGHELFHRVQYSYDGSEVKWFKEGTARAMEDLAFDNIDNWATTLTAVSSSFNKQVNTYLNTTNADITSDDMRYNSALWWKYYAEQYGSITAEPQRGVDAMLELWKAAETSDDIAAVNAALTQLDAGVNFDGAFRRFTVANWTKDLTGVPDASYNYIDEDQAGNGAPYGPLLPSNAGAVNTGSNVSFTNQTINRYGASYYRAQPGTTCPVLSVTFTRNGAGPAFFHVVGQNGTAFVSHTENAGAASWTQSFLKGSISQIVAIAGSTDGASNVDVVFSCANPLIDVKLPNNVAVAYAGPFDAPGKILVQVLVTNGSATGPVVGGLSINDFKVRVNGLNADITAGGFIQEQYWMVVQSPVQASDGTYNLEVSLEQPGTATVLATDTNASSVLYSNDHLDHALVIDRSGSMADGNKMDAAKAAAAFYVDITRNTDGLAVVPYNSNVSPAPFNLQSADLTVRNNAKTYINNLTPAGATSIGDGMDEAAAQINASTTGNAVCSMVLLSDGMENSPQLWNDVKADVIATGCPVTTIAFGPESSETLMQDIATQTGGAFFYNDVTVSALQSTSASAEDSALDLADTYEYSEAFMAGRQRLYREQDVADAQYPSGPVEEHIVTIDASVPEALFAFDWIGNQNVSAQLEAPDGSIYGRPDFRDDTNGHLGWRVQNPQVGQWKMRISFYIIGLQAPNAPAYAVPYQAIVSGPSNITVHLLMPDKLGSRFFTGNKLPIYAFVSGQTPIAGATVQALVTAPNGNTTIVALVDDGNHGDGDAGDGLYGGSYTKVNQAIAVASTGPDAAPNPKDEGGYRVRVRVLGSGFQREALGSFAVEEGPDVNTNGLPDPFETEYGVNSPTTDPDLDGLNTGDEYIAGTDPTNSDSDGSGENDYSEADLHSLDPLDPSDDKIEAPDFLTTQAINNGVVLRYDVKAEYTGFRLYRSTSVDGPWTLLNEPTTTGIYTDTVSNGTTYYYRFLAIDADNHRSAVLDSVGVTPSADPHPPEALIIINENAPAIYDLNVMLHFGPYEDAEGLANYSDISEMKVSNSPTLAGAAWQPFDPDLPWTLAAVPAGQVTHVYALFRDSAGNESAFVAVGGAIYDPSLDPQSQKIYLPLVLR